MRGEKSIVEKWLEEAKNEIKPLVTVIKQLNSLQQKIKTIEDDMQNLRNKISSARTSLQHHNQKKLKWSRIELHLISNSFPNREQ